MKKTKQKNIKRIAILLCKLKLLAIILILPSCDRLLGEPMLIQNYIKLHIQDSITGTYILGDSKENIYHVDTLKVFNVFSAETKIDTSVTDTSVMFAFLYLPEYWGSRFLVEYGNSTTDTFYIYLNYLETDTLIISHYLSDDLSDEYRIVLHNGDILTEPYIIKKTSKL